MERSQRARGLIDHATGAAAGIDAEIMEESAAMTRSQQARGLIDHATGTADELNAAGIEESAEMARSKPVMGLINHATGDVNSILCGNGVGGWGVVGCCHGKGHSSRHGWMSQGGQELGTQNYCQQQRENLTHLQMRRGGGQEYNRHIGHQCCHYFPCHHQIWHWFCRCCHHRHWAHDGRDHGHGNDHHCGGSSSLLSGMTW